jgi:hypothetical protein
MFNPEDKQRCLLGMKHVELIPFATEKANLIPKINSLDINVTLNCDSFSVLCIQVCLNLKLNFRMILLGLHE